MSTEIFFNLSASELSIFVYKLFKGVGTLTNLLMCSLSISTFKVIESFLVAKNQMYQHF